MKYYIIAGEASGDLHGANLMSEIKLQDSQAEFRFWGGDLMSAQGGTIVKHYRETAFMGLFEVIKNLGRIKQNFKLCKSDLLAFKPDVLILIDYPGFNLRMAEFAKNSGLKVFYYISPKIWAWKKGRVYKIKKFVDKMFIIFPFEKEFYAKYDYPVEFVGNPLLDAIKKNIDNPINSEQFRKEHQLSDKPIIALLAGSRKSEIKNNLPMMLKIIEHFPDFQFVMAAAPSLDLSLYDQYIQGYNLKIVFNKTYDVLQQSSAAIVTSGTATLEAALFNIPEICCYRGDNLSYRLFKLVVDVKYISLVNLVVDKLIIKELIQFDMTVEKMKEELSNILFNKEYRENMLKNYREMQEVLGGTGASARSAKIMVDALK